MMGLLAGVVLVAPVQAQAPQDDFHGHIDNAKLFIRKQYWQDALLELESAVALDDGRIDPEAWFMLATVRYELCDLEGARAAAARAHSYSRNDEQLQQASGLSAFLTEQFAVVEIRGPYSGLTARLDVELQSVLFDPNLKLYLAKLKSTRLDKKVMLPIRVGLPAGTYQINGRQLTLGPAEEAQLVLDSTDLGGSGPVGTQLAQAELGVGVGAWLAGQSLDHTLPAPTTQLAFSQPVGPVVAGLMVDWTPRPYHNANDDIDWSPWAWTGGARVGLELADTQPLVVRTSLGYRFGTVPGVELSCLTDPESRYRCTQAVDGDAADLKVYAVGRAHIPMVELSVDYLDRTRTSTVGVGVKVIAEEALGTLPANAQANLPEDGGTISYEVLEGDRTWTATGFRALLNLSLAF